MAGGEGGLRALGWGVAVLPRKGQIVSVAFLMILLSAVLIGVGVVGAVVQVWPSGPFVAGGILVWALQVNSALGWTIFALAALVLSVAFVAKYVIPGRKLTQSGIPNSTLIIGLIGAIAGWVFIPVVGFIVGLVGAIFAVEYARRGSSGEAWESTRQALGVIGLSILIELVAALTAASLWVGGVIYMALTA